jgi:DNA-binding IclR family transcriptional regulator
MGEEGLRPRSVAGAQTVDRACRVLNDIARHGVGGARLIDLTNSSKLSRPTVHRILQSLCAADLVRQEARSRRYRLGVALHGLALAAPSPLEHLADLRPLLDGLARRTGDTAYLMMRLGDEVQCQARAEGASLIRTLLIDVGAFRPIGATIAGITMLSALDDEEIETALRRTALAMARHRNATPEYVRRQIANVRQEGYCVSSGILIEGITGISAAVPSPDGRPFLAVSISAVSARVPKSRVKLLAKDLLATCNEMARVVRQGRATPANGVGGVRRGPQSGRF